MQLKFYKKNYLINDIGSLLSNVLLVIASRHRTEAR